MTADEPNPSYFYIHKQGMDEKNLYLFLTVNRFILLVMPNAKATDVNLTVSTPKPVTITSNTLLIVDIASIQF